MVVVVYRFSLKFRSKFKHIFEKPHKLLYTLFYIRTNKSGPEATLFLMSTLIETLLRRKGNVFLFKTTTYDQAVICRKRIWNPSISRRLWPKIERLVVLITLFLKEACSHYHHTYTFQNNSFILKFVKGQSKFLLYRCIVVLYKKLPNNTKIKRGFQLYIKHFHINKMCQSA